MPRLSVRDLTIRTAAGRTLVDGISFDVEPSGWLAVIGESGSGKSLTASSIGGLLPDGVIRTDGVVLLDDQELTALSSRQLRSTLGKDVAYVFQDYSRAFTPYLRLGDQMGETLRAHGRTTRHEATERIRRVLSDVGLPPEATCERYPFQLSGGQLQRAALATAMLLEPRLLIADEPTTALDAVTQVEVLDLIHDLRRRYGCSVLFITHDLRCATRHADQIAVMQQGRIVECGTAAAVSRSPQHPYTRALFSAVPRLRRHPDQTPTAATEETR